MTLSDQGTPLDPRRHFTTPMELHPAAWPLAHSITPVESPSPLSALLYAANDLADTIESSPVLCGLLGGYLTEFRLRQREFDAVVGDVISPAEQLAWDVRVDEIPAKRCCRCRQVVPRSAFHRDRSRQDGLRPDCRECSGMARKRWYELNRERLRETRKAFRRDNPGSLRGYQLRARFGLELEDYEALLQSQEGLCAICRKTCVTQRFLAVDHNHETGRIRGLLCNRCNQGLGFFCDDVEVLRSAAKYLEAADV